MTVAELMDILSKLPKEAVVRITNDHDNSLIVYQVSHYSDGVYIHGENI